MSNKPVGNSNTMNITGSTVGNAAQVSGSPGATVTQTSTSNDLKSVHEAIDRLAAAVKSSPTIDANTKNDAQMASDQLKGELQKSKPSSNRIQQALDWFKALDSAATILPHVLDLADKLKTFLPGVF